MVLLHTGRTSAEKSAINAFLGGLWHASFIFLSSTSTLPESCTVTGDRYTWHVSFICVTWLIRICDMSHSHVWRDSIVRALWLRLHVCDLIYISAIIIYFCPASTPHCRQRLICVPWLLHKCDVFQSCVWHDTFTCDVTYLCVCRDSFICATWHIHTCDMSHSYVGHLLQPFLQPHSHRRFKCMTWLIHMCDVTHSYMCPHTIVCVTWLNHACTMTFPLVQPSRDTFICVTWLIHLSAIDFYSTSNLTFTGPGNVRRASFAFVAWLI